MVASEFYCIRILHWSLFASKPWFCFIHLYKSSFNKYLLSFSLLWQNPSHPTCPSVTLPLLSPRGRVDVSSRGMQAMCVMFSDRQDAQT